MTGDVTWVKEGHLKGLMVEIRIDGMTRANVVKKIFFFFFFFFLVFRAAPAVCGSSQARG